MVNGGEVDSNVAAGLVASTNPTGEAGRGSDITVYVSNGALKVIPSGLVGQKASDAQAALVSAGFTNVDVACSPPAPGSPPPNLNNRNVESVNPGEGQAANPANQVTLYVKCS